MIRLAAMSWIPYLAYACSVALWAQPGLPDPVFDRIPFDQWLKESGDAHIRWTMAVLAPAFSAHQRMSGLVSVRVDGAEFVKRSGPGQLVIFLEIRDRDDRAFRTHRALKYDELRNPGSLASVNFDQYAFLLPGDYQVAAVVLDTGSKEHSVKKAKLRVPEIPHDPLPESWRNLPAVEYVTIAEPPDSWYFPDISSRLYLPVQNERPVRVEVVVNESPTEATQRVGRAMRRNMGNLIPALKALTQMDIRNGSVNVTLLDLERRKVTFAQEGAAKLDWGRLRGALLESDPNTIDVHALENHEQNAQFFVSEVRKRLESTESNGDSAEPARVLIVLSGPMAFPRGQDLTPIEATPEPGTRVFYIRYLPPVPGLSMTMPGYGGRNVRPSPPMMYGRGQSTEDSLARTLKPLAPRIFNVTTPLEFRNALAAIISEISRLK
jgi:hypothetical protein